MLDKYMPINLQFFAEGEGEGVNDGEAADLQNGTETDTGESDANVGNDGAADQKPVQSADDNAKFAAARRESEKQVKEYKTRMDNFARQYGYNTFEEMEYAQQVNQYQQAGYDQNVAEKLAQVDTLAQRLTERENNLRIAEEKTALKGTKYFADLEPDIDAVLKVNPNLNVRMVFDYMKGQKLDSLIAKETAAAKQKTLNNINSKQHLNTEGDGAGEPNDVHIPEETLQMYMDMGMSRKDAMKHHKKLYG